MAASTIDEDSCADGDLVGFSLDDGSPVYAGRRTRVFFKGVRPDLRSMVLLADEEFDSLSANSKRPCTVILCAWGHTAVMKPRDFRYLKDCVFCLGKRIWPGFNDLETLHPNFVDAHWAHGKNDLDPTTIGPKLNEKVWLSCEYGHEAEVTLASRLCSWLSGHFSCRRCQGLNRALRAEKSLQSEHPDLALQWDPANGRWPHEVTPGSGLKAWWVCALGHRWQESVAARSFYGTGCPYCSGHRALAGFNDLATTSPEIAAQWHPDNDLRPTDVTAGSNVRVKWLCPEGHSWETQINARKRNGCPKCARAQTSLVERLLWDRVGALVQGVEANAFVDDARDRRDRAARCDAVLRDRRAVLEYDGEYWHRDRLERDEAKTEALLGAGWSVVRIREEGLSPLASDHPDLWQISAPVWWLPTVEACERLDELAGRISRILNTIPSSASAQMDTKETK